MGTRFLVMGCGRVHVDVPGGPSTMCCSQRSHRRSKKRHARHCPRSPRQGRWSAFKTDYAKRGSRKSRGRSVRSVRWSAGADPCPNRACTIAPPRVDSLWVARTARRPLAAPLVRRLALEIMTEVVVVAREEQVRLEKVSGTIDLDWIALRSSSYPRSTRARGTHSIFAGSWPSGSPSTSRRKRSRASAFSSVSSIAVHRKCVVVSSRRCAPL